MQTQLSEPIHNRPQGREAERILRSCVHCGFCNATCPTYQLIGDEDDGPRGRIYMIKQMLEGEPVGAPTLAHLDRCLSCRNCETTCPAGVEYGHLMDIGRALAEERVRRPLNERGRRWLLRCGLLNPRLFAFALGLGRLVRPVLPSAWQRRVPVSRAAGELPSVRHARRMLLLEGCVQPALSPDINAAARRVFDRLGISLVSVAQAGCCGAISQHLSAMDEAKVQMRRNIDAWWPLVEQGAEAIVITASGCGAQIKDYGHLLSDDTAYAAKAEQIAALAKDPVEVLAELDLEPLRPQCPRRIAFHPPCTLQHGQRIQGVTERLLRGLGHELTPVRDAHLCCGSAGTYSILQPELSSQLRDNKLGRLAEGEPELIATANIGCQTHLQAGTGVPVVHWLTLLDEPAERVH